MTARQMADGVEHGRAVEAFVVEHVKRLPELQCATTRHLRFEGAGARPRARVVPDEPAGRVRRERARCRRQVISGAREVRRIRP